MKELLTEIVRLRSKLITRKDNIIVFAELAEARNDKEDQIYQSGRHLEVENTIILLDKILNGLSGPQGN